VAACVGTETGNPSFEGTLSYNAHSSDAARVALLSGDPGAIVVNNAWLVLGDVGFVEGSACNTATPASGHADGLGIGDHAPPTAASTPLSLEAGRYCGVHLPLVHPPDVLPTDLPSEIAGHSVLINGTLADGRRFLLRSASEDELFLLATTGAFALDAELPDVLIGFDVATWLGELSWASAVEEADGSVLVDETHNESLLQEFESHLASGTTLFRDVDGLGQVRVDSERLAQGMPTNP
jgi:hypothetical protein